MQYSTYLVALFSLLLATLAGAQVPVTSNAGVGAPSATTPASTRPETSVASFSTGSQNPVTTTSAELTTGDASANAASLASKSSQGVASGNPSITTTGASVEGISTGLTGGYDNPAQTATTADPAAGTIGGNSGVLQQGQGNGAAGSAAVAGGGAMVWVAGAVGAVWVMV